MKPTLTQALLIGVVTLLVIYDVIAVMLWGIPSTVSYVILSTSHAYPVIPFGVGVVAGHLFWPNVNGKDVIQVDKK